MVSVVHYTTPLFVYIYTANNVANEMANPIRTVKTAGPTALGLVFFLYFFANSQFSSSILSTMLTSSSRLHRCDTRRRG